VSDKFPPDRDDLDALLARGAKEARRPRGVPAPAVEASDDALLRVLEGTASAEERAEVAAGGAFTRDRLDILREAVLETGHAPPLTTRAARYVLGVGKDALSFLRGDTSPVGASAPVAVRSGVGAPQAETFLELHHRFPGPPIEDAVPFDVQVRLERTRSGVDLQVRVLGKHAVPAAGTRVAVMRNLRIVDSTSVDASGNATFTGLAPARYSVEIRVPWQEAERLDLELLSVD
jgi:hypothetical protein